MELPATPRSSKEVDFFVDETPCENCGKRGTKDDRPQYRSGAFSATCVHCGTVREFQFAPLEPHQNAPLWHLGPVDEPSKLFDAAAFRAAADRELALVPDEPAELPTLELWTKGRAHLGNARTALNELAKFKPNDAGVQAEINRVVALYEEYNQAKATVDARPGAHPKPTGLDQRFAQHRAWVGRGRTGDGQMVFRKEEWSRFGMTTNDIRWALFEDTTFTQIDFSFSRFQESTLRRTRFLACNLMQTEFDGASFERCDMTDSRLGLVNLIDVVVVGGDWQNITGGRSTWRGRFTEVDLRGARLRDSVMDDASFDHVDLRGADVSRLDPVLRRLGTAYRARFVDCDLRGMDVEGWRLDGTVFERCRMHGLVGTPALEGEVQIVDCDFSANGDGGADDVGGARVLASWRKGAAS
jgi:uncharacterized protein YjbI with pentapeptide repeats